MILNEVLANFLNNAIKFTPSGNEIIVFWEEYDDGLTISIEDRGIGMTKDFLESILSSRRKLSFEGTDGEKGSGYGIRIALKTVKNFMGKVRIKSFTKEENPLDYGTKVRIDLRKI